MSSRGPTKEEVEQLMEAAQGGSINTLKYLIEVKQIDVDTKGPFSWDNRTPLLVSASKGHANAVHYLIDLGANIHAVDWLGACALHYAAEGNSTSLIDYFINAGIDVNVVDRRKRTPLLVSARKGHANAVHYLIDLGANIHAVDHLGACALHYAAEGNSTSLIDYFINAGIDVNVVDGNETTPLLVSASKGYADAVHYLIDLGANIHAVDVLGACALHYAAEGNSTSLIDYFINAGIDVNVVDNDGNTPLHNASRNNRVAAVEMLVKNGAAMLVKNGAAINHTNKYGDTPLHDASRTSSVAAVEMLVKNGAAINHTNNDDKTPLQVAVSRGYGAVVWTFIKKHKVDISQYDEDTKLGIRLLLAIEEKKLRSKQDSYSVEETDASTQSGLSHEVVNEAFLGSTLPSPDVRVAMMGTEGSGKTCLGDTLTGQDFKDTSPTEGADEMEVVVKNTVDWSVLTKEEMIENLQQQVLQEAKHCAIEHRSQDSTVSATKATSGASSLQSNLSKSKPDAPSLPVLKLPGGDKMYILTIEEFKQLPSIIEKYDPLRRYLNIWDYAGQHVFQHTHGLFVSEEVVCLIVFDASKLLEEIPKRRYKDDDSPARSSLESITYWMDLISCRVSKKSTSDSDLSEFLPTFILVGTKIDLLTSDIKEAEERFISIFKEKFAAKPFAKHIAGSKNGQLFTPGSPSIFFLSNRDRNLEVVAKLQHVILVAAPKKSRPTRLVKMERKLMLLSYKEKMSVVDMEQVKEVAKSCGISQDNQEVLEVLKFFHQKGTLLYFNQVPALSNVIILSPQWLAKLLTYILTNLICQPAGLPLAKYAEERNKKGLLRQELINYCLDRFLAEESRKGHKVPNLSGNDVADLLLKFKLMVDVTDASLGVKRITKIYLAPHLLPVQEFVPATGLCYKIFYYFPGHFIPDTLLDQLIVKCAEWNKRQKFGFLRLAYQWISMKLGGYQSYQLRPIHKINVVELTISSNPMMPQEEEITALAITNELIAVVKMFIDDLMQESMEAAFEQYPVECYLPCPACSEVHVELEEIKQSSSDICPTTNEFIDMMRYHKMLTQKNSGKECILFSTMLEQEPQMKHLNSIVVPRVAAYWNDIALNLDFTIQATEIISKKCFYDPESCCKELFKQWLISSKGKSPKIWSTLLTSLKCMKDLRAVTEEIEKELEILTTEL